MRQIIKQLTQQIRKQTMEIKKYLSFMLLTLAVCVGFTSCGSDDEDEPKTGISQIIVGEWDSAWFGDVSDIDVNTLNVNDTELNYIDSRLVFNSNGKGYEIDQEDGTKTEFSYKVNGNTLQMTAGSISQTHKIIKYSDNVVYSLMESEQSIFKMVRKK